jgi:hypothetical protein
MENPVDAAWAELKKLPLDEQAKAAEAILDYAAGVGGPRLTDEQVAETARRLSEPHPTFTTLAEVRARFRRPAAS